MNQYSETFSIEVRYRDLTRDFLTVVTSSYGDPHTSAFAGSFAGGLGFGLPLEVRVDFVPNGFRVCLNGEAKATFSQVLLRPGLVFVPISTDMYLAGDIFLTPSLDSPPLILVTPWKPVPNPCMSRSSVTASTPW